MKFENLSKVIIAIIDELLKNQELVNYLGYNGDNPSLQSIDPKTIAPKAKNERIVPHAFDVNFKDDVRSQLNIYYPNLSFENNGHAGKTVLLIDVVVHKSIWLLTDKGQKVIRPYEIMRLIFESLKDKHVKDVGKIHFIQSDLTIINDQFEGYRIAAVITDF